jgi:hypothetical protein
MSCDTIPGEGYVTGFGNGPDGNGGGSGGGGNGGGNGGGGSGEGDNYFDSDDNNPDINPGVPEICNGIDDNGDGQTDEGVLFTFFADADGDSYGNALIDTMACTAPFGFVADSLDCHDADSTIHPNRIEICNGLDDDCDGLADDADPDVIDQVNWYRDMDDDGYGNPLSFVTTCYQPNGYVENNEDCNDLDPTVHPGAEVCNDMDDDCDGEPDDGLSCAGPDSDGDGIEDEQDNCLDSENPDQADTDCDTVGDACDVCPGGDDRVDNDNDGYPDCKFPPLYQHLISAWKCGNNKVYIAHQQGNGGWHTICVNYNAVQAHVNHGDYIGQYNNSHCNNSLVIPCQSENEGSAEDHDPTHSHQSINGESGMDLMLEVFPIPASQEIHIHLHGITGYAELVIIDQLGRIHQRRHMKEGEMELGIDLVKNLYADGLYTVLVRHAEGVMSRPFVVIR